MKFISMVVLVFQACAPTVLVLDAQGRPARLWWDEKKNGLRVSATQPSGFKESDEVR